MAWLERYRTVLILFALAVLAVLQGLTLRATIATGASAADQAQTVAGLREDLARPAPAASAPDPYARVTVEGARQAGAGTPAGR